MALARSRGASRPASAGGSEGLAATGRPKEATLIQKQSQFHASLVWLFDMTMLVASFWAAHAVRFTWLPAVQAPREETMALLATAVVVFTLVFRASGLYHSHRLTTRTDEIFRLFKAIGLGLLLTVAVTYFFREGRYSRLMLGLFGVIAFVVMASTRTLARDLLARLRRRGINLRRALVVGAGQLGQEVAKRLEARPDYGIKVVGFLARDSRKLGQRLGPAEVVGTYDELEAVLASTEADQVYLALPLDQHDRIRQLLAALSTTTADVKVVPDFYQYMTLHGGAEEIDGLPVVALSHGPVHGWDAVAKRTFDLVFGSLILLVALPAMAAVAAAVKLTSKGPLFYAQERMGLDGRTFKILKFRSMRIDAETTGAKWATAGDDRTTPIGRVIRKYSLDELPQFFNVLKGDMSLVGPRPERPVFIEDFKRQIPRYNQRHKVKAGITGLAQVEGWRGSTSLEKRIERDLYYIEHWSVWLDFKILVRTVCGGFLSKNAY
jgi:Undecaprenyl-phosphate glucose phosphotransferase